LRRCRTQLPKDKGVCIGQGYHTIPLVAPPPFTPLLFSPNHDRSCPDLALTSPGLAIPGPVL
jgi:hypothetical protein